MNLNGQLAVDTTRAAFARRIREMIDAGDTHFSEYAIESSDVWVITESGYENEITERGPRKTVLCVNIVNGSTERYDIEEEMFPVWAEVKIRSVKKL